LSLESRWLNAERHGQIWVRFAFYSYQRSAVSGQLSEVAFV
jgi:hypothetical protein